MCPARPNYPPPDHFLRDLRLAIDRTGDDVVARLALTKELADTGGRCRVGVLATLVDVIGGELSLPSVLPNRLATSDVNLCVDEIPRTGSIETTARVLRSGRRSVVLEATLRDSAGGRDVGVAQIGFSILPSRGDAPGGLDWEDPPEPKARTEFATTPGRGLNEPILEKLGLLFDADDPATTRLAGVPPYVTNMLGGLQGGAVAILLEAAGERFAAARFSGFVRVRTLTIHFLRLGRIGPFRAEAREIARTAGGLIIHVTLIDEGATDALVSVATMQVDEANSVA